MTKDKKKYILAFATVLILSFGYLLLQNSNDNEYNKMRCETKGQMISGVISEVSGRSNYMVIFVDGKSYSFDIKKVKYTKGVSKHKYYGEGDSIFKKANSNEVTIRNSNYTCVLELRCDE